MRKKLLYILSHWPFFLLFAPVFFLVHALSANFSVTLYQTAVWQVVLYSLAGLLLSLLFYCLKKDYRKAAMVSLSALLLNFTFGYMQAHLQNIMGKASPFNNYYTALGILIALVIGVFLILQRLKDRLMRLFSFLNILFFTLSVYELFFLAKKHYSGSSWKPYHLSNSFTETTGLKKPDIYIIVADEYAGERELQEVFGYDNSSFLNQLRAKGFHVVNDSRSNYNHTVYSMASLFNMGYLPLRDSNRENNKDVFLCRSILEKNNTEYFLGQKRYSVFNASYLAFGNKKPVAKTFYFSSKASLLGHFTFISRFNEFLGNGKSNQQVSENSDQQVADFTSKVILHKDSLPKLVYTHFLMPHPPYIYDSTGRRTGNEMYEEKAGQNKEGYISFLKYTNTRLIELVNKIISHSANPPIILLVSDHGFRQFPEKVKEGYYFMNLCAVYFPDKKYDKLYDGMSMVNLFRIVLNSQFGQQLPMLPDRQIFID